MTPHTERMLRLLERDLALEDISSTPLGMALRLWAEMRECRTLADLREWWSEREVEIRALPRGLREALVEAKEKRKRDALRT